MSQQDEQGTPELGLPPEAELETPSELELLKNRARMMGIKFHPKISLDKLKERVSAKQKDIDKEARKSEKENQAKLSAALQGVPEGGFKEFDPDNIPPGVRVNYEILRPDIQARMGKAQKRQMLVEQTAKLARVKIVCMNPNKRDWEGEILSVGNSVMGQYKKYVPFNVEWHVPQIMLNYIQDRKCQIFFTTKGPRGEKIRKGKQIPEFSVQILDPLTKEELHDLAIKQARAQSPEDVAA